MGKKLRWGILGTAGIAKEFIRAVRHSRTSVLTSIASRDRRRAGEWAKSHGIPSAFGSYDELLKSGEADLIYVPLPNSMHAEWTIRSLEAGCHVLCEKPLASNAREAAEIARAAGRLKLHAAEAFMYRHHPQFKKISGLIAEGSIGKLTSMRSRFTFMLDDPSSIAVSPELAGGALMDVGCYCVDFSRMIAGSSPLRVSALEERSGVDRAMSGVMEFPGAVLASFETGFTSFERRDAEILGTGGAIVVHEPWLPRENPAKLTLYKDGEEPRALTIPAADSYLLQIEEFVEAASGRAAPRRPISDAVANMAVIDALYESARTGRAVRPSDPQ